MELIKSPDNLLNTEGFAGLDCANNGFSVLSTGLGFGAVKNNKTIGILLDAYNNLKFINEDGSINLTPCPAIQSKTLKEYGFEYINKQQQIMDLIIFPSSYFSPERKKILSYI